MGSSRTSHAFLAVLFFSVCREAPVSPQAYGPAPVVELDTVFGTAPLSGVLRVTPGPGSNGWGWRISELGSRHKEISGIADGPVSIRYRYEAIGVHPVRIELVGPEGLVVLEKHVVVHDSANELETVARRSVEGISFEDRPEGMAIDPVGRHLFAGDYLAGEIVRLDSSTLEVRDRLSLPAHRVEGLAVTPDGGSLLAVHEKEGLTVVDLEEFGVRQRLGWGRWFLRALEGGRALTIEFGRGHGEGLRRLNFEEATIEASSAPFVPGHFDLDPGGGRVAVANHTLGSVDILEASSLTRVRSISIGETLVLYVAFDPRGEALYALTRDGGFLVLDPATGEIRESIPLGPSGTGLSFNGTVVFGDGKYVALDHGGDVVIVDTDLDLPRYRFRSEGGAVVHWSSLAATPDSEFLFVLNGPEGSLSKVRIR